MPELPEVETTVRGLRPILVGQTIARLTLRAPKMRFPFPTRLAAKVKSRTVVAVTRRAKYILIALDDGATLLVHLGMSGRLAQVDHDAVPGLHDHVVIELANGRTIHFRDPRKFGLVDYVAPGADPLAHKYLAAIGPEPLDEAALTPAILAAKLKNKIVAIKQALLDQRLVAGLGNIYVCEALYYSSIRPTRAAGKVTKPELARLVPAIRRVLNISIKAGGSSLRDYAGAGGDLGHFQRSFAVYDREGESCPACPHDKTKGCAGDRIVRIAQGGRSSWYCPVKQK